MLFFKLYIFFVSSFNLKLKGLFGGLFPLLHITCDRKSVKSAVVQLPESKFCCDFEEVKHLLYEVKEYIRITREIF